MSKPKTSREAFEECFRDRLLRDGVDETEVDRYLYKLDDEYTYPEAEYCWETWQAALKWESEVE